MKLIEIASKIAASHFKVGDIVEYVNNERNRYGDVPCSSYIGRRGEIKEINPHYISDEKGFIIVKGFRGAWSANRFKKVQ